MSQVQEVSSTVFSLLAHSQKAVANVAGISVEAADADALSEVWTSSVTAAAAYA